MAVTSTVPLFGSSNVWTSITQMANTLNTETTQVVSDASTTDFSDPGAVVLLQMRVNQVTNAATAVSNLVKAIQEPSKNAVSNLR
ncbi:hypothetical protein [Prosthecobacter dejongeii]|uniref:16S rRNA C1402 (Ribose-2'-O) methylase RsmI n=1 Tax=Prosthecobacter dejongeii TaxID=48465 RepID=A0A7W7YK78_9BACT|nr:hypothetical protein [Prosthecobacter dejongeii]MBB5037723.1 16S rRNA C1402 (ribose-2'-O) methylase RsmI [Prosthecobacter dejongeii]